MPKRQLTRADKELLAEVARLLEAGEALPTVTQLERWRQHGLIPETERVDGRRTRYPAGAAAQVLAVMRHPAREDNLDKVALPLLLAGYRVTGDELQRVIAGQLERVRTMLERYAGARRRRYEPAAPPLVVAEGLAAKLAGDRLSRFTRTQTDKMLAHLDKPLRWLPDDSQQGKLKTLYTCLFFIFLTGHLLPESDEVIYQAFVAYGFEAALADLLSPEIAGKAADYIRSGAVGRQVRQLSLPHVLRSLRAMKTQDFERARADFEEVYALVTFFVQAGRALLPPQVEEKMPWVLADGVDWHYVVRVVSLPLLFSVRRRDRKPFEALLTIIRNLLPEWQANFEAQREAGVFADDYKREEARAGVVAAMLKALMGGSAKPTV